MLSGLSNAFRGIGGHYEINRLVGFIGGLSYIVVANGLVGYEVLWEGRAFDLTAYCLTFPTGLAAIAGGTAAAISLKDRNVASSKIIEQTGAVPTPASDGAQVPSGDPPPVTDHKGEPGAAAEQLPSYAS